MYQSDVVKQHLEQSSTVESRSLILAEWNLNSIDNISKIGNYRYRPVETVDANGKVLFAQRDISGAYDSLDVNNDYTGATDSDTTIDGGYNQDNEPIAFASVDKKMGMLFSLEQCFDKFRPRSGINKMIFDENMFINDATYSFAERPRYYIASRDDTFKYWTSIRREDSNLTGSAYPVTVDNVTTNYINDACPFVVYKNQIPANKIVVKIQTNVGTTEVKAEGMADPFFGESKMTVPKEWKVEYLDENDAWQEIYSTTSNEFVNSPDGYFELQYGLIIPEGYSYANFIKAPVINSLAFLPDKAPDGYAYLLIENAGDIGTYFVANSENALGDTYSATTYPGWDIWQPSYGWKHGSEDISADTPFVSDLVSPPSYLVGNETKYREFSHIKGLRLVVKSMNTENSRLDLIELSPRLSVDLSYITASYSVTREAADLGSSPMPIGGLLASTGSLELFDNELAFSKNNKNSILNVTDATPNNNIVYNIATKNMQAKFYEILRVNDIDYYIPIKTLYSEALPQVDVYERRVSIELRDMFGYFESKTPQDMLVIDQPVSYIIATLLDNAGFSNYRFYRIEGEQDEIIPYFFISKDTNIAQVLSELAVATQSAMFFDEYNNLIIASKGHMFDRTDVDFAFSGTMDSSKNAVYRNERLQNTLANIQNIAAQDEPIYNDGKVSYSEKYIQKTVRNIAQASKLDKDRNWVYKPVMLWEISEKDAVKSINGERDNPGGYALTAIPLKDDISASIPAVEIVDGSATIVNNIISFGDSVYFVGRYNGYFYANGEVIKYDAVEYAVPTKAYSGFTASTTDGSTDITITSGNAADLSIGDRVYKATDDTGDGLFGKGSSIIAINEDIVTLSKASTSTGDISFTTTSSPTVWITSIDEYESYFAKIPFNGKMYPTGRIRIFAEANYDANDNLVEGVCKKHGRGQFGTQVVEHKAGLDSSWTNKDNLSGCYMSMSTLVDGPKLNLSSAGKVTDAAQSSDKKTWTAKIELMRRNHGFYVGQQIYASKSTTLSETGTIGTVSGSGPYTATVTNLVSSNPFYIGQVIESTADSGDFKTGTVTVTSVISSTSITISSTATMTAGNVTGIRVPEGNSGDLGDGTVTVTKPPKISGDGKTYYISIKSTAQIANGDISSIYAKELPRGGYKKTGKTSTMETYANKTKYSGLIKNYLAASDLSESVKSDPIQSAQMVQSSALVVNGPSFNSEHNAVDYISYTSKSMPNHYKFFGTRMRIIGQSGTDALKLQTGVGSTGMMTIDGKVVSGSSGGISILMNPKTNTGYYFEIAALTDNNVKNYTGDTEPIDNLFFYKMRARYDHFLTEIPADYEFLSDKTILQSTVNAQLNFISQSEAVGDYVLFDVGNPDFDGTWEIVSMGSTTTKWKMKRASDIAYPEKLWSGMASIQVDSGNFFGAGRMTAEPATTVFDIAVEYEDVGQNQRKFYLYVNNLCVGYVTDTEPTDVYDQIALFTRGSSRIMFENVYALSNNYSENTAAAISAPIANIFKDTGSMTQSESFKKYALSGAIQSTYLSGIGSQSTPAYNIFYDEFGTIMRECAYFNIKYDQAYPALRSMLAPTFTTEKGYTISGFYSSPYGAEFLLFNNTDTVLALDESSGNYLRILGVAFTQDSQHDVTVDDYFSERGSLSNTEGVSSENLSKNKKIFQDIKNSRSIYGKKEFSFESPFIQSRDAAEKIMGWTIGKIGKSRKALGLSVFPNPMLQLGDIVTVDYFDVDGVDVLDTKDSKFVVYSIEYQKESSGPSMTVHLSEVG